MSASKCGDSFQFILGPDVRRVEQKAQVEHPEYSGKAAVILQKILKRLPNFVPLSEDEIFYRARSLGITEEE